MSDNPEIPEGGEQEKEKAKKLDAEEKETLSTEKVRGELGTLETELKAAGVEPASENIPEKKDSEQPPDEKGFFDEWIGKGKEFIEQLLPAEHKGLASLIVVLIKKFINGDFSLDDLQGQKDSPQEIKEFAQTLKADEKERYTRHKCNSAEIFEKELEVGNNIEFDLRQTLTGQLVVRHNRKNSAEQPEQIFTKYLEIMEKHPDRVGVKITVDIKDKGTWEAFKGQINAVPENFRAGLRLATWNPELAKEFHHLYPEIPIIFHCVPFFKMADEEKTWESIQAGLDYLESKGKSISSLATLSKLVDIPNGILTGFEDANFHTSIKEFNEEKSDDDKDHILMLRNPILDLQREDPELFSILFGSNKKNKLSIPYLFNDSNYIDYVANEKPAGISIDQISVHDVGNLAEVRHLRELQDSEGKKVGGIVHDLEL